VEPAAGDAVIAVSPRSRSPPREVTAQPGSELHRQLSDPDELAAAARAHAAALAQAAPRE
jgi:hypothetical protein